MFGLGTTELIIILVIVIMIFGVGKLPMVAKQLGAGMRSFQKSVRGEDESEEPKNLEEGNTTNLNRDGTAPGEKEKAEVRVDNW
ncbi:MAG: twin-arginine translocase TatA/TatE family subunit [Bradymonadaceae bacterium]